MLKKILCGILIICCLLATNRIERTVINGEEKLLTTFNESDFTLCETDLNVWGEYSKSYMSETEMKILGLKIAVALGLDPEYKTDFICEDNKKVYTVEKKTELADTNIKVVEVIEKVPNNSLKVENYIIVNIILRDRCNSIIYYRDKIKDIYKNMNIYSRDNLTITSKHKGKIDQAKANEIIKEITKEMKCEIKDSYKTEDIYSVYGYSNYINEHVITEGEKINMDLALTYNEIENITYLYVAIPVITIDY
ncbi:MAG: YwmB family TATA-box binding protein [Vallitalea sp.]|jgi:hypothetical protein|nr:YwmB family TATA-box binding protein [Vallitalea sp.]